MMRAYPDVRTSRPRKWFWLVGLVPVVQVWANVILIGFWQQPHKGQFNPVLRRPFLSIQKRPSPYVKRIKVNF